MKNFDTTIELIVCPDGDWEVLKIDGEIFEQGHSIQWEEVIRFLGYNFKETCISNKEMEEMYG